MKEINHDSSLFFNWEKKNYVLEVLYKKGHCLMLSQLNIQHEICFYFVSGRRIDLSVQRKLGRCQDNRAQ